MANKGFLTKILAIAGCLLAWFPILSPAFFSLAFYFRQRSFRFDYLMPAELFPAAFFGAGLLFWAAMRAHAPAKLIGFGVLAALGFLVISQWLAVVTGLAAGVGQPEGVWWIIVLVLIGAYSLALVVTGIGGIVLLKDIFAPARQQVEVA